MCQRRGDQPRGPKGAVTHQDEMVEHFLPRLRRFLAGKGKDFR